MPKKPPLTDHVAEATSTLDVPEDILLQIGRLTIVFAALENLLGLIPATLLGITPMEARIAVRSPRMKDVCEMIATLCRVHEVTPKHDLVMLSTGLRNLEEMRDWFAHGIWAMTKNGLGVRVLTGSWQPAGLKLPAGKNSIQRRVVPAVAPVTAATISELVDAANDLIPQIDELHQDIRRQMSA